MLTPPSARDVATLLSGALTDGTLSKESASALLTVPDLAARIAAGFGAPSLAPEVMLVSVLADDSSSIARHAGEVSRGQGRLLDSLGRTPRSADVIVQTRLLSGEPLDAYRPLAGAPRMEVGGNYVPRCHMTPLFDQSLVTLAGALAKSRAAGPHQRVRTFTLLITDGQDNVSSSSSEHVASVVADMVLTCDHIVAGMGIGDDDEFHEVFERMGIAPEWILTADQSDLDIAAKFASLAGSLRLAASSERAFRELASGRGVPAEGARA